jgi:AraC-like DNA-binding protein
MKKKSVLLTVLWCCALYLVGQPLCRVTCYDEEDGLPHGHVTQILQDRQGLMWLATWNGLCRYDGYEFRTFKPSVGDGCHMAVDRLRDIVMRSDGEIICRVDEDYFLFNTRSCKFRDMTEQEAEQAIQDVKQYRKSISLQDGRSMTWKDAYGTNWMLDGSGRLAYTDQQGQTVTYPLDKPLGKLSFACTDQQGNLWVIGSGCIYTLCTDLRRTQRLPIQPAAEVKCLFADSRSRYWIATKGDQTVRVYSKDDDRLLGYLGADGRLHPQYTPFGAAVYCMYESKDGTLWLGTKPDGLYRLCETAPGQFHVTHITALPNTNVYGIIEDRYNRLWVATLGGGLCYTVQPQADNPRFTVPQGFPQEGTQRLRYLHLTAGGNILMATATDGLIVAKVEQNAEKMRFQRHFREPDRATSLSSSATMDIMEMDKGIYVSTESGGVNRVMASYDQLDATELDFHHLSADGHQLPTDVALSLTPMGDGRMMVVSNHLVSIIDTTEHVRVLDARYFSSDYRFSDAHPLRLNGNRWLFGLTDGAFVTSAKEMYRKTYQPRMVLTGVSIQGGADDWSVAETDTLLLQPRERSITLHFAALDYSDPGRISYGFRMREKGNEDGPWNYIGHDRSATFLDLTPGTYVVEMRSTDAEGQWTDNARRLTLIVKPTFWESAIGRILAALLILGTLAVIVYTLLYIRRINRRHRETLEKYLALIEGSTQPQQEQTETTPGAGDPPADAQPANDLDPMLKRVMAYIEENIGNSDVGVGDMAAAAATSRSGLQRKLKYAMGITPLDLLREARIKHACQLLRSTDKSVSEVAYACGFSDPKYFSRTFKQGVGLSPTEYKNAS